MMNITDLRIVATVACFVAFIGIWVWAWSKRHKNDFNEAANLPFEGE